MRSRWLTLVLVVALLGTVTVVWSVVRRTRATVDLLPQLAAAEKRANPLPVDEAIRTVELTIDGQTKRGILQQSHSRLTFKVVPPPSGWFSASVAVDPAVWNQDGDGVQFRVGVSDGAKYHQLMTLHVDPAHSAADRRWIPVSLDLADWAGRDVSLILNVDASLAGRPVDLRNDRAVWGSPMIYAGR